jgi:uncharacterized spore protein YtfJ
VEDVENLIKTTMGEIEKILSTKTVVGDPIVIDGRTLVPLTSFGFGFGAGGGSGKSSMKQAQEGSGGGSGGAAGVRPVAVIISDEKGVRIESIRGGLSAALERVAESAISAVRRGGREQGTAQGQGEP